MTSRIEYEKGSTKSLLTVNLHSDSLFSEFGERDTAKSRYIPALKLSTISKGAQRVQDLQASQASGLINISLFDLCTVSLEFGYMKWKMI